MYILYKIKCRFTNKMNNCSFAAGSVRKEFSCVPPGWVYIFAACACTGLYCAILLLLLGMHDSCQNYAKLCSTWLVSHGFFKPLFFHISMDLFYPTLCEFYKVRVSQGFLSPCFLISWDLFNPEFSEHIHSVI